MLNLNETTDEAAFREEVRQWVAKEVPDRLRNGQDFETRHELDRLLAKRGFLGFVWPREYGGSEGSPVLAGIMQEELAHAGCLMIGSPSHQGMNNIGPAIIAHGTPAQKDRFITGILSLSDVWCQGFSEPDAGSDLAAVQTVAQRDGDSFIINGTKIWTSWAHRSDWIYVLARTGEIEQRHKNLSMFLIPMSSPGITTSLIKELTGRSEFSEVHLNEVRTKVSDVLGDVNDGWRVAQTVLGSERLSGRFRYFDFRVQVKELGELIATIRDEDRRSALSAEFGVAAAQIESIRPMSLYIDSLAASGQARGMVPSISKVWWATAHGNLCDLGVRAASAARRDEDVWYVRWLRARAETIYGGSIQIQRNLISERLLGLPRS